MNDVFAKFNKNMIMVTPSSLNKKLLPSNINWTIAGTITHVICNLFKPMHLHIIIFSCLGFFVAYLHFPQNC